MARDGIHGASDKPIRRNAWFYASEEQILPRPDSRYRVNASSRLYIAQLVCGTSGCTLNVNEGAERTRIRKNGQNQVRFEGELCRLRPAHELEFFLKRFVKAGCSVYVGGIDVDFGKKIDPAPFIYLTTKDDFQKLRKFHPKAV